MRSEILEKAVKQTSKSFPFTSSILLQQHQEKPIGMGISLKLNLTETPQMEKVKPKTIFREKCFYVMCQEEIQGVIKNNERSLTFTESNNRLNAFLRLSFSISVCMLKSQ